MKTKAQKKEALNALAKEIPSASIVIFSTFARTGEAGLSVSQMQQLKRALRAQDGTYLVAKKTLVDKALSDLHYDGIDIYGMEGSLGLVVGSGDAHALAKAAYQFAKTATALKLLGAWTEGHAMTREQLIEMATMPSRDELLTHLMGMLTYPFASLAIVLGQIEKSKATA